jgi:hypothetical protein
MAGIGSGGSNTGPLELGSLLKLLHGLLSDCEVKFTLQLLDYLHKSRAGRYVLNASTADFQEDLQRFYDVECQNTSHRPLRRFERVNSGRTSDQAIEEVLHGQPDISISEVQVKTSSSIVNGRDRARTGSLLSVPAGGLTGQSAYSIDDANGRRYYQPQDGISELDEQHESSQAAENDSILYQSDESEPRTSEKEDVMSDGFPSSPQSIFSSSVPGQVNSEPRRSSLSSHHSQVSSINDISPSPSALMAVPTDTTDTRQCLRTPQVIKESDIDVDDVTKEQENFLATASGRFIVHPNHRCRVGWDLLVLLLIVVECVTLPLTLAYSISLPGLFHVLSITIFGVDMVLSTTTGYYHGSLLIMRRRWIVRQYVRTWFVVDFCSLFPWEEIVALIGSESDQDGESGSGGQTTFLRILKLGKLMRVLRLLRLAKINALIKRLQNGGILPANMLHLKFGMSVTKMFVVFGFLAHWAACIWGLIGDPELLGTSGVAHDIDICTFGGPCEPGIQGSPWRRRYGLDNYDAATAYIAALQFSTALITGGESPMQAGSVVERLFMVIASICSVFVISVVVGEILLIMNRQEEARMVHDEQMQQAHDFLVARKVPMILQARIYTYMETQHSIAHGNTSSNRQFMSCLSPQLQSELVIQLNQSIIIRHPFFRKLEEVPEFSVIMEQLCVEASPSIFAQGEYLVQKGMQAIDMHFIVQGKVRVENPVVTQQKVLYLKQPSWLGDLCLFVDTLRMNSVTAVITTETLTLTKANVKEVCAQFESAATLFRQWRKKVIKDKWSTLLCPRCRDIGHCERDCPEAKKDRTVRANTLFRLNSGSNDGDESNANGRSSAAGDSTTTASRPVAPRDSSIKLLT